MVDIKALILAIDRDDDFGEKAGVEGPVIGRDACIDAALKLSLADPEDSDANVVYAAVKLYDELRESGEFDDVEVALITGHPKVGVKSDMELARQLELVLERFPTDGVITVTDGAEDEQIFPIITSKVPIISSHRVVVKQSEGIETTYYIIYRYLKEILSDPEVAKVVLGIPGMILLLYGIARLIGVWYPESVKIISATITGTILLFIGGYFFTKGFRFNVRETIAKQFVFVISVIAGVLIIIGGAINAYFRLEEYAKEIIGGYPGTPLLAMLIYINALGPSLIIGVGVMITGKVIQSYLRKDYHIWYYTSTLLMMPALWVTIDLTTRYAMAILTLSDIEVFTKLLFALGDVAVAVLVGIYMRGKVRGWERVEAGASA
ncbi:membrane protein, conserved [Thermococcus sp. 4557]|uniref:DUF373 family protein n=1 Tax=Thermococcus sp. (strain CGMCC 1.5172 / 4557) TaxID=1042877 RepID=UPI000219ED69|nr:DUF373 family protein [Thermococcus sp. 4557]AEK72960.1 membrane protein, conserved [Thermococcus sp. 4557]